MSNIRIAVKLLEARIARARAAEEASIARERMIDKGDNISRRRWLEALGRKALAEETLERLDSIACDSAALAESLGRSS